MQVAEAVTAEVRDVDGWKARAVQRALHPSGPEDGPVFADVLTAIASVFNRGNAVATSVHVYSPPLSSMIYYDHADGELVAVAEDAGTLGLTCR